MALPSESASGWCFLELYVRYIRALQAASGAARKLPLAIMTSDDTHDRTLALLQSHDWFGMDKAQVRRRWRLRVWRGPAGDSGRGGHGCGGMDKAKVQMRRGGVQRGQEFRRLGGARC